MKILRLIQHPVCGREIELHPDSAMLLEGRPMFYPDFGEEWHGDMYLAVRINRLGKRISRKFAPRYYDGISLAVVISPTPSADNTALTESGWMNILDNSITHGRWVAPGQLDGATVSIEAGGESLPTPVTVDTQGIDVDGAVEICSRYTTLRTGDIILLPLARSIALSPKSRIVASDGLLNVKVV